MLRLAQAHLDSGDVNPAQARVVHGWLTGERVGLRELREVMIYTRIGRHNARTMLTAIGRLLLRAGHRGLVVHVDLTLLAEARRPPLPERTGIHYSKAAVLDAYELLRQLVDATDDQGAAGCGGVRVQPRSLREDRPRRDPGPTRERTRPGHRFAAWNIDS